MFSASKNSSSIAAGRWIGTCPAALSNPSSGGVYFKPALVDKHTPSPIVSIVNFPLKESRRNGSNAGLVFFIIISKFRISISYIRCLLKPRVRIVYDAKPSYS
jgi:hypothetical protein